MRKTLTSLLSAISILLASQTARAAIETPVVSGQLIVHYNPDVALEAPSNIAWVEFSNIVLGFSTPLALLDPENYGFNMVLPSVLTATTAGLDDYAPNALTTLDLDVNPTFEYGPHGGMSADWTIDYYSPENGNPVSEPSRSRAHTVQFGSAVGLTQTFDPANDGTGGPSVGKVNDIQHVDFSLVVDDGIYHSINDAEFMNNSPAVLAAFGWGNYNDVSFRATLVERDDQPTNDGINIWDISSGSLVAGEVPEASSFLIWSLLGLVGFTSSRRRGRNDAA